MDDDPESPFLFEKKAFKTKFEGADVDGKEPTEEDLTCGGSWDSCPEGLDTALDFDAIWKQVTSEAKVSS